jgi:hypothetical protein
VTKAAGRGEIDGIESNFVHKERRAQGKALRNKCTRSVHAEWQRRTQIVAIGAAGSSDAGLLENMFASCIAATAANGRA